MYKTYSIYWRNDTSGGCAIISNTAMLCVTTSLACDFSELSIFPVMIKIVKSNMDYNVHDMSGCEDSVLIKDII